MAEGGTRPPERPPEGADAGDPRRALLRLALLALTIAALFAVVALSGGLSSHQVRDWVHGAGIAAPLLFIVLSAGLTVAFVPGPLLAGAAGLLFGTALGTPCAIASATLGACLAFELSRRVGARSVEQLAGARLAKLQAWIAARGFLAVLYARILPAVPYNLVNYAAGLTRVPLATFAAATAIGCAPRAFAYVALGGSLDDLGSPAAIVAIAVLVAMALVSSGFAWRDWRAGRAGDPA